MTTMERHFANVAPRYRDLRTTDAEPVDCIAAELQHLPEVRAADVGCGAGRYDLKLFQSLGQRLFLACVDTSKEMLGELTRYLLDHGIEAFQSVRAGAGQLPFSDGSLHCIFSFNAVHHFPLFGFLEEAARVLRDAGHLFIYTRLRRQNAESIWGRHFPFFREREDRLYELDELLNILQLVPRLALQRVEFFRYRRIASVERLEEQARSRHYSTFSRYHPQEFEAALEGFKRSLGCAYPSADAVAWYDQNALMVIRKVAPEPGLL